MIIFSLLTVLVILAVCYVAFFAGAFMILIADILMFAFIVYAITRFFRRKKR